MQETKQGSARNIIVPLLVFALLSFALSCRTPRRIADTNNATGCNLKSRGKDSVLHLLKKHEFDYRWMTAKINAAITKPDSTEETFTINMRARKDSAIWIMVSKLGIEGARVLVTKDSVKFLDQLKNRVFRGDYAYLSKMLQAEVDFEMLQAVLLGNSAEFYEDERYRLNVDNSLCQYRLATIRKQKLRRVIQGNKEMKDPVQAIWLRPDNHKISRIFFFDFDPDRNFEARFDKFETVDSMGVLPMLIRYDVMAEGDSSKQKKVVINLEYSKVSLNKPQTFPFNIPSNYEQITNKEK
jgi:hypothetical protein